MADEVIEEEIQVLESIYPTELTIVSPRQICMEVEPDAVVEEGELTKVLLEVTFPEGYPDVVPDICVKPVVGNLGPDELKELIKQLNAMGEENIGIAMTFTLVTHLKEALSELTKIRLNRKQEEAKMRELQILEEEEKRFKGTPVTRESFMQWKIIFDKELAAKKMQEEDERLRAMTPREREEYKKIHTRLSGKQLFERHRNLEDDTLLFEDGVVSVDASQYKRNRAREEQKDKQSILSDSE